MPAVDDPQYPAYKERLDYEISVLADNGTADFLPYIFVLEDAVDYASKVGLAYNTRGSAGGSLIVYLLGISITDPIKYNLPFERFMTLGRILSGSLPDIDTDWEDRGAIIDYIVKKYGENCSLIATDLNLHLKSSILDVERAANGSVSFETQQMCKRIPPVPQGISDHDWLYGYMDKTTQEQVQGFWDTKDAETLKKWAAKNPEMWRTVEKCIGITKTRGVHAGGVVVSPEPVASNMPVVQTKLGTYASAYNMKGTEYIGGVKYDFLGVVALKALSITMKALRDDGVADLKWAEFPYDPKVFTEQVSKGLLASVFQLNTKLVAPFVAKIPPKSIVEMSNLTALCRPGALDADAPNPKFKGTAADYYVACARGEQPIYYIHPDLEPIFKVTYGICIFQEQTLQVFRDLAGYSFADAEEVRRAIGKKDKALMDKHLGVLVEKLIARGWSPEQGRELCETLVASARYSFNCSHSTSYAIVAYNQLYLKQHYPLYYWKGALTAEDDLDKIRSYMGECGHLIKKIDGLKSHPTEWIISDGGLRPPLSLIKGCGAAGAEAIYTIAQELNNEKHETNIAN
jgi:DNA polymerase-3 subunit alpha